MNGVLIRRESHVKTDTQGESYVAMEAETGQRPEMTPPVSVKGVHGPGSEGARPSQHLDPDFWPPSLGGLNLLLKPPIFHALLWQP